MLSGTDDGNVAAIVPAGLRRVEHHRDEVEFCDHQ
jgi:hypothetical protein